MTITKNKNEKFENIPMGYIINTKLTLYPNFSVEYTSQFEIGWFTKSK